MSQSKYRNVRTEYNGVAYASKAEATRAYELDLMVKADRIAWWIGQPKFRLGCPENVYVADALVIGYGELWVEDVKGVMTAKFRRDVKLWRSYGPCELRVIKGKKSEIIVPNHLVKGAS